MTHLTTPELIRALGGADAICREGCSCRGRYEGPERRSTPRHCPVEGCERPTHTGQHTDAEGFRWGAA